MATKRKVNRELIDDENPEWTAEDFKRARPASEVLSPEFLANWKKGGHTTREVTDAEYEASKRKVGERGPQKTPTKERITIRLSPDVLARFRESGTGWQGRVDAALREWLKRHSPE
jgi:uncharacterized protein (DUF4415 family)